MSNNFPERSNNSEIIIVDSSDSDTGNDADLFIPTYSSLLRDPETVTGSWKGFGILSIHEGSSVYPSPELNPDIQLSPSPGNLIGRRGGKIPTQGSRVINSSTPIIELKTTGWDGMGDNGSNSGQDGREGVDQKKNPRHPSNASPALTRLANRCQLVESTAATGGEGIHQLNIPL